ncbi:response regulator [Paenibacillus hamazuiensis]|uniref:response regulator n=1 Tax=Paenibacillus hamazuiensis TaxID=2936508 RepID=UPI00200C04C7|nr:response regulator [Paenibacillus hamazuiensis]
MYRVLIVDDEAHAVRGLQMGVDWEKLQIASVETAYNIRQAREAFEAQPADVLLCDIEMPQGSGLELAEWVRQYYPQTETIFLTCHADFSYAKQAIKLDSFDYMLKPVDYSELEATIRKALDKIRAGREMLAFESTYKRYYELWESHQPVLMERFWQDLIHQVVPSSPESIGEQLKKQNMPFSEETLFLPVYIRVQIWRKELTARELKIMEYALQNAAMEQVARHMPSSIAVPVQSGALLVILPMADNRAADVAADCDQYIRSCNEFFFCDLCCYIGKRVTIPGMVSMVHALQKLDENNVTMMNRTLTLSDMGKFNSPEHPPHFPVWAEWMKQGAKEKLLADLTEYMESLKRLPGGIHAQWLHVFYQDVLQMVFFVLHSKGLQAHDVFSTNLLTEKPERAVRSLSALQEWIPYVIEVAMNRIQSVQENMSIVEKVKRYIDENLGQQALSREDIASAVYLNPDYLTRVFKKEVGMPISDYLQQRRMQLAEELLKNGHQSVSDIALTVGYSNLSYFSTIFKKAVGVGPNDYRKQHRQHMQA